MLPIEYLLIGASVFLLLGIFASKTSEKLGIPVLRLGAIVSSTDAAAVFAVLRSRRVTLKGVLKPLLELESEEKRLELCPDDRLGRSDPFDLPDGIYGLINVSETIDIDNRNEVVLTKHVEHFPDATDARQLVVDSALFARHHVDHCYANYHFNTDE